MKVVSGNMSEPHDPTFTMEGEGIWALVNGVKFVDIGLITFYGNWAKFTGTPDIAPEKRREIFASNVVFMKAE